MELCTQCNLPEGAHTRRIFGHDFKRPQPQPAAESNPDYAADLVNSLAELGNPSEQAASTPEVVETGAGDCVVEDDRGGCASE